MPALYKDADAASLRAQRAFLIGLGFSLILLVVAASFTLLNLPSTLFAVLQAIALLLSLGSTLYLAFKQPQRTWYGTRALAESVKTVAWRFAMRAEPYEVADAEARARFTTNVL